MGNKETLIFGLSSKNKQKKNELNELLFQRKALQEKRSEIEETGKELTELLNKACVFSSDDFDLNKVRDNLQKEYLSFLNRCVTSSIGEGRITKILGGLTTASASGCGLFGLVNVFGTASTGVAISSLSGAAATNATLASLGGGAVAVGGMGMLGGIGVLSVVSVVMAIPGYMLVKKHNLERNIKSLKSDLEKCPSIQEMKEIHKKLISTKEVLSFFMKQYENHVIDKKTLLDNIHQFFSEAYI